MIEYNKINKLIDAHEVISFDIFDTLVMRAYEKPVDLFMHIELSMGLKNFQIERELAEAKARENLFTSSIEEVTFDQIYDFLPNKYQKIKEIEIEQELRVSTADENMKIVYEYAKKRGKRIIIVSDMYLPKYVVEKILQNAGFTDYEKLFLSSDLLHSKAAGTLFQDALEYCNCSPDRILHIGDNYLGDFQSPQNYGIKSFLYKAAKNNIDLPHKNFFEHLSKYTDELPISMAKALLRKRLFRLHDAWEDFGYQYGGMLTVGFCQWLKKNFDEKNIKHAFFVSRDGYIIKKIFNILYPDFKTTYLYASRRAYILAGISQMEKIITYFVNQIGKDITFREYFQAISIDDEAFESRFFKEFKEDAYITETDQGLLRDFFYKNKESLVLIGKKERVDAFKYLNEIGLFEDKVAIIDLGWRASTQESIENIAEFQKIKCNIYGYYLITHEIQHDCKVYSYLMSQNKPADFAEVINPLLEIFELIYTAPHAGLIKIGSKNKIFQKITSDEQLRIDASEKILIGIEDYTSEYLKLVEQLPLLIDSKDLLCFYIDFYEKLNPKSKENLSNIGRVTLLGNANNYKSIVPNIKKKSIGVIHTWPGLHSNAETEVIIRLSDLNYEQYNIVPLSSQGYILDHDFNVTVHKADLQNFIFCLTLHYEDVKLLDMSYYHALWNPAGIPMQYIQYPSLLFKNIISNDDFLIYGDDGMKNYLKSALNNSSFDVDTTSSLTASFSEKRAQEPKLENPKLFYCGVNWERAIGKAARHSEFFQLLDTRNDVHLYGSANSWEGYKQYQGMIPFDGFSIIDEINKCGVLLALSSEYHYRYGVVTNRIYEGCIAGAVIISDTNTFVKKHWGDSVLYIDYTRENPCIMFSQLVKHLNWIKSNPEQAMELAKKSQQIFIKTFTLEKQFQAIMDNHPKRLEAVAKAKYSQDVDKHTLVVCYCEKYSARYNILNLLQTIDNNIERNITLAIASDLKIQKDIEIFLENIDTGTNYIIVPFDIFDEFENKLITKSEMLSSILQAIPHNYFMILDGDEILFKEHITTLKRALENNCDSVIAYSAMALDSLDGNRYILNEREHLKNIHFYDFTYFQHPFSSGMFLFKAECAAYLKKEFLLYLDGHEVAILANLAIFSYERELVFSKHLTCVRSEELTYIDSMILPLETQKHFIQSLVRYDFEKWHAKIALPAAAHLTVNPYSESFEKQIIEMLEKHGLKRIVKLFYDCFVAFKKTINRVKQIRLWK